MCGRTGYDELYGHEVYMTGIPPALYALGCLDSMRSMKHNQPWAFALNPCVCNPEVVYLASVLTK